MHGLHNTIAPCGGVNHTDANDIQRGDDETYWLVSAIMGSPTWREGRNAIFIVFDEGTGPLTCFYHPDTRPAPRRTRCCRVRTAMRRGTSTTRSC